MRSIPKVLDSKTSAVTEIIVSGKKILVINYEGCKTAEKMISVYDEAVQFILGKNVPYILLANFHDSYITAPFVRHMNEKGIGIWHLVKKYAFVGMNSAKKYILKGFNETRDYNEYSFDSEKEAIEFLIKD